MFSKPSVVRTPWITNARCRTRTGSAIRNATTKRIYMTALTAPRTSAFVDHRMPRAVRVGSLTESVTSNATKSGAPGTGETASIGL